jgi:hypothetical protein
MPKNGNGVSEQKKYAPNLPFNLTVHHEDVALGYEYYLNELYGFPVTVKYIGCIEPGTGRTKFQFRVERTDKAYEDPPDEEDPQEGD